MIVGIFLIGLVSVISKWTGLKSVIKVESTRKFKNSEKPIEKLTRYYISSLGVAVKDFQNKIRLPWAIENKLHWGFGCCLF